MASHHIAVRVSPHRSWLRAFIAKRTGRLACAVAAASGVGLATVGCSDPVGVSPGPAPTSPVAAASRIGADSLEDPRLSTDAALENFARGVPGGLGGLWWDAAGKLHLTIQRGSERDAAVAAVLRAQRVNRPGVAALTASDVVVHTGVYSFAELRRFARRLTAAADPQSLSLTDVDEQANRIYFGVRTAEQAVRLRGVAERLGIPAGALAVEAVGEIAPANGTHLQLPFRPVPGGVQHQFSPSPNDICSVGVNVLHHAYGRTFVTASHCSVAQGDPNNNGATAQARWPVGEFVANKVADPPYYTGGNCPAGYRCRGTDAALYKYQDDPFAPWEQGFVARPTALTTSALNPILTVGTTDNRFSVAKWQPPICIIGWACNPTYNGAEVHKVGRTTGMTRGRVTRTCVFVAFPSNGTAFPCSDEGDYIARGGDSGSPVFIASMSNGVYYGSVVGIHFGGRTDGTRAYFHALSAVEAELGANSAFACNGFQVVQYADLWNC